MSNTPQFTIKTGADSSVFFSREVTGTDVNDVTSVYTEADVGKIKSGDSNSSDNYEYPVMTRRTGHSIKGTTDTIESNELRSGRTKSAPRKGNSSSEGSLDVELSPDTYDDILEAALRSRWQEWQSDTKSPTNLDKITVPDGCFITKTTDAGYKKLVGTSETDNALIVTNEDVEVRELVCGTDDIKYSALVKYGGTKGEDLFQEFEHLAVNEVSLNVTPGEIVTGSFSFVGSNNPNLVQKGDETGGIVKELKGRFVTEKNPTEISEWIDNLPKKGTSTDQYTAREGFLYLNKERVRYGGSLSFSLNNGLEKTNAIFEKDSIATSPLSLDITGTLSAYLIKGYTEKLYEMQNKDEDVEFLFAFQDKEENPENLYVIQIFKTKLTDSDISQDAGTLDVSFPFQSFEERACRIINIRKRRPKVILLDNDLGSVSVELSSKPATDVTADDITAVLKVDGIEQAISFDSYDSTTKTATFSYIPVAQDVVDKIMDIAIVYNGKELSKQYVIDANI